PPPPIHALSPLGPIRPFMFPSPLSRHWAQYWSAPMTSPSARVANARIRPALAFSLDGRRLAVGDNHGVHLWDVAEGRETATLQGGLAEIFAMAFSPDGRRLATAAIREGGVASAGEIRVWDVNAGREVVTFSGAAGGTYALAFAPDGR